ncbi:helix-turn-helix domain-containing protein, partial [Streptococcus agalactiae]|nr:helix-turn-helix domain-containing protein [Streptococcus agalactiae]
SEYNQLEVFISFLRKKLRFLKADIEIITTKGFGYSLEERT